MMKLSVNLLNRYKITTWRYDIWSNWNFRNYGALSGSCANLLRL